MDKSGSASNSAPSFKCPESSTDLYTVSSSSKGNKALANPIGLITADEVAYAGGVLNKSNSSYYLYTGQYYWTLSPSYYNSIYYANVNFVLSNGGIYLIAGENVSSAFGVRPVINLKADTAFADGGKGTSSNPYVVKT